MLVVATQATSSSVNNVPQGYRGKRDHGRLLGEPVPEIDIRTITPRLVRRHRSWCPAGRDWRPRFSEGLRNGVLHAIERAADYHLRQLRGAPILALIFEPVKHHHEAPARRMVDQQVGALRADLERVRHDGAEPLGDRRGDARG